MRWLLVRARLQGCGRAAVLLPRLLHGCCIECVLGRGCHMHGKLAAARTLDQPDWMRPVCCMLYAPPCALPTHLPSVSQQACGSGVCMS